MTKPSDNFEKAKTYFLDGLAKANLENWESAEIAFRKSLEIIPERESTISNLLAREFLEGMRNNANMRVPLQRMMNISANARLVCQFTCTVHCHSHY